MVKTAALHQTTYRYATLLAEGTDRLDAGPNWTVPTDIGHCAVCSLKRPDSRLQRRFRNVELATFVVMLRRPEGRAMSSPPCTLNHSPGATNPLTAVDYRDRKGGINDLAYPPTLPR